MESQDTLHGCIDDSTGGILIVIKDHQLDLQVEKFGIFIQMEENYLPVKTCRSSFQEGYHVEVTFLLK